MKKRHLYFGLTLSFISLITACTTSSTNTSEKQLFDQRTKVVSSDNNTENHIYSMDTQVTQPKSYDEPHAFSLETEVLPYEKSTQKSINNSDLIGHWIGGISMGNHEHPLTFDVKNDIDGRLSASYTYWGMDTRAMGSTNENEKTLDYENGNINFILPESGVKFEGQLVSTTLIEGTVEWMGLSQPLQLKKMPPPKTEDSKLTHQTKKNGRLNIAILVFDGVDVLDWAGPLEVFVNAHSFNTFTVAPVMKAYDGGGYQVTPKYTFANMPKADILIIPGGGVAPLFHQPKIMEWIKTTSKQADITMSVCNAANLLAGASMLDGLEATTHGSWMDWLNRQASQQNFRAIAGQRFIDNGKIITTAGVSAGIDGSLHVVARLKGLTHARMTASMMEYDWQPDNIEQYK
jgi:putative intracellular protease/amidase